MAKYLSWYRWVDTLSIDVALGAVVCAYYFSLIFATPINPTALIVLGLSVWIIYTADHLKDASRIKSEASTVRHKFHQQHFRLFLISIIGTGIVVIIMLLSLDKFTLLWGFKLSVVVLVYLVINHYLSFTKEIVGGILYCIGILLPSISQVESPWSLLLRYEVLIFGLLVIINLFLFSGNELREDSLDNHKSFALRFGKPITMIVVKSLIGVVAIILLLTWSKLGWASRIIFCLMTLVLIAIAVFPKTFEKNDRYRYWGDLIFLFPVIALIA